VVRRKVLPSFKECDASVKGIASRRFSTAREVADEFNLPTAYSSVDALLEDPSIDAVYIATPVSTHAELTITAAKAGKHVLCEKPMAMSSAEALDMQQVCREHHVHLEIAYYRRYYPVIVKLKALLEAGKIGEAKRVRVNCHSPRTMIPGSDWRYDPQTSGGGVLMDIGSHRIDLLVFLFGKIICSTGDIRSLQQTAVEDDCLLHLQFEQGVEADLSVSWSKENYEDSILVEGNKGRLWIEKLNAGILKLESRTERDEFILPLTQQTHSDLIGTFEEKIKNSRPESFFQTDAIQTTLAIEEVYRSNNYFTA